MTDDTPQTSEEPNPWRETVRDIFDMIVLTTRPLSVLEQRVLDRIESGHHDYFCVGKTIAEWEEEERHGR